MKDLENKVAIVLGASTLGGMGEVMARRLTAAGAKVVVSGLGAEHLHLLAGEIGGLALEADITDQRRIADLVAHTKDTYGRLDIAVNAAGFAPRVPFKDLTEEHLMHMAKMHFIGPAMFIKHVAEVICRPGHYPAACVRVSGLRMRVMRRFQSGSPYSTSRWLR